MITQQKQKAYVEAEMHDRDQHTKKRSITIMITEITPATATLST